MEYRVHVGFVPRRPHGLMGGWGGVGGWGGIITNVVVALKSVKRCGCCQEECSTPRAQCVW